MGYFSQAWQILDNQVMLNGGTAPSATGFHLILLESMTSPNVLSDVSTIAQVVANEKGSGTGYTARYNLDFANATWNATNGQAEPASVTANVTASGGTLTIAGYAILRDSTNVIGNTTGGVVFIEANPISIASGVTRPISITLATAEGAFP